MTGFGVNAGCDEQEGLGPVRGHVRGVGIPYLFIKVAVGEVAVPVVVFARTATAAVLLLPLALRRLVGAGWLAALRAHWRPLAAFATLEMIVPRGLLSQAERTLPSSLAGLLIAAVPIISVVVARPTGGTERLSLRRWARDRRPGRGRRWPHPT